MSSKNGHAADNLAVVEDAARTFYGMDAIAIKSDMTWLRKKASRLPPLEQMTAADKDAFREAMNRRLPLVRAAKAG